MTEYQFQLSTKVGADLVNIAAPDAETFEFNLKWVEENAAKVAAASLALASVGQVAPLAAQTASTQVQQTPAQTTQAGPGPSCQHGPMKLVAAGTSKAGRAYSAFWACTQPRGQQCQSQQV